MTEEEKKQLQELLEKQKEANAKDPEYLKKIEEEKLAKEKEEKEAFLKKTNDLKAEKEKEALLKKQEKEDLKKMKEKVSINAEDLEKVLTKRDETLSVELERKIERKYFLKSIPEEKLKAIETSGLNIDTLSIEQITSVVSLVNVQTPNAGKGFNSLGGGAKNETVGEQSRRMLKELKEQKAKGRY